MINNFGVLSKNGDFLKSKLGIQRNMYNNTEDPISLRFFNLEGNGLYWEYLGNPVKLFSKGDTRLLGYPSIDLRYVIVIYSPYNNVDYPAPSNAVIYNPDGSIRKILYPPTLISERAKNTTINDKPALSDGFELVLWNIDSNNDNVTSMWVGFGFNNFEERVIDVDSGQFKECLGSSRI